jgi:hypothetical protein
MAASNQLESTLNEWFGEKAPKLPEKARKMIVEWAPWASLVVGVLTLWLFVALWQWAHFASSLMNYTASLCAAYANYGCTLPSASRMTLWVWVGLLVLAVQGLLYILAFPGLRAHKKAGWNFLYWGALVNVVYAVVSIFMGYNGLSGFVGALIGSAIGLWLLFQVRGSYGAERKSPTKATK